MASAGGAAAAAASTLPASHAAAPDPLAAHAADVAALFEAHGRDAGVEIEARFTATAPEFAAIMGALWGDPKAPNPVWAVPPAVAVTHDFACADGTRVTTSEDGTPVACVRKQPLVRIDVAAADGRRLARIAAAREEPVAAASASFASATSVRIKRRATFLYKHEVAYELTEVRTGATLEAAAAAEPAYEVEIEWVGQAKVQAHAAGASAGGGVWDPAARAVSFLAKLGDLLAMQARAHAPGAARASLPPGWGGEGAATASA